MERHSILPERPAAFSINRIISTKVTNTMAIFLRFSRKEIPLKNEINKPTLKSRINLLLAGVDMASVIYVSYFNCKVI